MGRAWNLSFKSGRMWARRQLLRLANILQYLYVYTYNSKNSRSLEYYYCLKTELPLDKLSRYLKELSRKVGSDSAGGKIKNGIGVVRARSSLVD